MNNALVQTIIENDQNDGRFETFARQICEQNESTTFVSTSSSWDRGRDARSTGRARGSHESLICCTLNKDLDPKVEADLLKVTATSSPDRLVYCSSQFLSEHRADEITKTIRRHIPKGSVLVLGSKQLADLTETDKRWEIFERHYHSEVEDIKARFFGDHDQTAGTVGLRLALITFGSDDAVELRKEILHRAVLEFLQTSGNHSSADIARLISQDLGMSRPLQTALVDRVLQLDRYAGRASVNSQLKWSLTPAGKEFLHSIPTDAANSLLKGRTTIRETLEKLLGQKFTDIHYDQIWSALLDFLSNLFYSNGLAVIKSIDDFLSEHSTNDEGPNLRELLRQGAQKVGGLASTAETRQALQQAVMDTLTERSGPAFEWLTQICERFVILCSLGLEPTSGSEIRDVLKAHQIVPDSDIVLSLICKSEPDHKSAHELMKRSLAVGGKVLLSPVVLEEVAYHASISERDFRETEHLLGKLSKYELRRYIQNAFVREYHFWERKPERWGIFIGQFRGNAPDDYSKILKRIRPLLSADLLPENYDDRLRSQITNYLMRSAALDVGVKVEELDADFEHKISRDGRLLSSLAWARASRSKMSDVPIVILSSSRRLRRADNKFRQILGEPKCVISIAAFSYMLSLVPDSGLGAGSVRMALFEFGEHAHLHDTERRALRIIRSTQTYDLPWANRSLLQEQLNSSIRKEASKLGMPVEKIRREINNGSNPQRSASILTDALTSMAVKTSASVELERAQVQLRLLQNKVVVLEDQIRKTKIAQTRGSEAPSKQVKTKGQKV